MSPTKKEKKRIVHCSKNKLKKSKDSDSEDDGYETYDEEESVSLDSSICSSEYETVSDSDDIEDEDTESSYTPSKKKSSRKVVDDSDEGEEEDDENVEPTRKEIQKIISKIFPSKYMKEKVKKNKDSFEKKNSSSEKKSKKKNVKEDESEYDSDDDESEDSDYDPEDSKKKLSIIFGLGGSEFDDEYEDNFYGKLIDDENEECNSDDEKTFVKETYQQLDIPEQSKIEIEKKSKKDNSDSKKSSKKKSLKKKSKSKEEESDEEEEDDTESFENEYNDLVDMKKLLTEKLNKNPKSKYALKALQKCKEDIRKLIKKTRGKNTKDYHKMITSQTQKYTSEMDYFKKKLSNKEQLKIMNDLKEVNEHIQIDKPYRLALLESKIPTKYKASVMQKLNMLKTMDYGDSEYYKTKNWVDTFMRIPFGKYMDLKVNISDGIEKCQEFMENSMKILDECTYGMNDAKTQILQMVGQWIYNPDAVGTAIAIHGPMGTGKTTLVKEGISKILGREFAFIALGGAGDGSYLEGHSYTYEGSTWGKIVQILIDSKCMNPVIYFDELDKVSDSPRGQEIIGILTHLTDTSQNSQYHDKYFSDVDFDLSKCLFIFSYNDESLVNPILRDRMYKIKTKGYDKKQKYIISKNYLLPKICEQVKFENSDLVIPNEVIEYIVENHCNNEDGVRNLKRCLEIIYTKLNLYRIMKPGTKIFDQETSFKMEFPFTVTKEIVDTLIKKEKLPYLPMYV